MVLRPMPAVLFATTGMHQPAIVEATMRIWLEQEGIICKSVSFFSFYSRKQCLLLPPMMMGMGMGMLIIPLPCKYIFILFLMSSIGTITVINVFVIFFGPFSSCRPRRFAVCSTFRVTVCAFDLWHPSVLMSRLSVALRSSIPSPCELSETLPLNYLQQNVL